MNNSRRPVSVTDRQADGRRRYCITQQRITLLVQARLPQLMPRVTHLFLTKPCRPSSSWALIPLRASFDTPPPPPSLPPLFLFLPTLLSSSSSPLPPPVSTLWVAAVRITQSNMPHWSVGTWSPPLRPSPTFNKLQPWTDLAWPNLALLQLRTLHEPTGLIYGGLLASKARNCLFVLFCCFVLSTYF